MITRLITEVPPAVAKAAMESGVAKHPIKDWEAYKEELAERLGTGSKLMRMITRTSKSKSEKCCFCRSRSFRCIKSSTNCL